MATEESLTLRNSTFCEERSRYFL